MNTTNSVERLAKEIEKLRKKMILTGINKGLSHPDTIKISFDLDQKLNIYQKMQSN